MIVTCFWLNNSCYHLWNLLRVLCPPARQCVTSLSVHSLQSVSI